MSDAIKSVPFTIVDLLDTLIRGTEDNDISWKRIFDDVDSRDVLTYKCTYDNKKIIFSTFHAKDFYIQISHPEEYPFYTFFTTSYRKYINKSPLIFGILRDMDTLFVSILKQVILEDIHSYE